MTRNSRSERKLRFFNKPLRGHDILRERPDNRISEKLGQIPCQSTGQAWASAAHYKSIAFAVDFEDRKESFLR